MKKRIRLLAFLFALTVGIGCIPVAALEERDAQMRNDLDIPFVEWTYDNSMVITAITSDSRAFSPADFPGVSCKKVFMLKKETITQGIQYTLVLWMDVEQERELLAAMETVRDLPFVDSVDRTGFGEYVQRPSTLTLDHDTVTIPLGETVDIHLGTVDLYSSDHLVNIGIDFKVTTNTFDLEDSRWDWLSQKNPQPVFNSDDRTWYRFETDDTEDVFSMVAELSAYSDFLDVRLVTDAAVSGNQFYEYWVISDPRTASVTLSGGEIEMTAATPLNQTAHVRGIKAGKTTLTLYRGGFGAAATATCEIIVSGSGEIGDVNADGQITATDALLTLQHVTQKLVLDDPSVTLADFDGDGSVTAADALQILQCATGKIF